ncbi:MAG: signal peptidase II [Rhodospirillales bacterium]|nr:signal peptidase II [Rhodospirillales bacterium]
MRVPPSFLIGLAVALVVVVLDQASKWWIVEEVMQPPRHLEVTSYFNLVMGWNRGVSFGLFNTVSPLNAWVLTGAAVAIVAVLLVWLYRTNRLFFAVAIGFVVGGAIGNVIDRVRYGAVADFLQLHLEAFGCPLGRSYCYWPAFNLADTMITIGAFMIVLDTLFTRPRNG